VIQNIKYAFKEYLEKYFAISTIFIFIIYFISRVCFNSIVLDLYYSIWTLALVAVVIAISSYWLLNGPNGLNKTYALLTTLVGVSCGLYFADKNSSYKQILYTGYTVIDSDQRPCAAVVLKRGALSHIQGVWISDSQSTEYDLIKLKPHDDHLNDGNNKFEFVYKDHILNGLRQTIPIYALKVYDYNKSRDENPDNFMYYPDEDGNFFKIDLFLLSKIENRKESGFSKKAKQEISNHIFSPNIE